MKYKYVSFNFNKIPLYPKEDIEKIRAAGLIAYKTLEYIKDFVKAGVSTLDLNNLCHDFIIKNKCIPAPLNYRGFPKSICVSVNHVVCHGIPSEKKILKEGDILNIDVTVIKNGFFGDTSTMFTVGEPSIKAKKLIQTTYKCLIEAIKIVKPGILLEEIGKTIENIAKDNNFSVVEDFCGHGIGHVFHQEPQILHYANNKSKLKLEEGMVFTIEPMINTGKKYTKILNDGWTAVTKDHSLSAQFEHTIAVVKNGYNILTLPKNSI